MAPQSPKLDQAAAEHDTAKVPATDSHHKMIGEVLQTGFGYVAPLIPFYSTVTDLANETQQALTDKRPFSASEAQDDQAQLLAQAGNGGFIIPDATIMQHMTPEQTHDLLAARTRETADAVLSMAILLGPAVKLAGAGAEYLGKAVGILPKLTITGADTAGELVINGSRLSDAQWLEKLGRMAQEKGYRSPIEYGVARMTNPNEISRLKRIYDTYAPVYLRGGLSS